MAEQQKQDTKHSLGYNNWQRAKMIFSLLELAEGYLSLSFPIFNPKEALRLVQTAKEEALTMLTTKDREDQNGYEK